MSIFKYFEDETELRHLGGAIYWLPKGNSHKPDIFRTYGEALLAPNGYFGDNWDAFSDCLLDLGWIKAFDVFIVHREMPCLSQKDTAIYLDILRHVVGTWADEKTIELSRFYPDFVPHRLTIFFPKETECLILAHLE